MWLLVDMQVWMLECMDMAFDRCVGVLLLGLGYVDFCWYISVDVGGSR